MKKFIILILFTAIISGTTLYVYISSNLKVEFIYEPLTYGEPTFKFTASSKHFSLATGEAYYNDEDVSYNLSYIQRSIIIKNFKLLKEIKNLKTYSLNIRFYDLLIYNDEIHYQGEKDIRDFLDNMELNSIGHYDRYSSYPFFQSKESEFKDNLKISIKYCLNNDKCYEEKLKIKYID